MKLFQERVLRFLFPAQNDSWLTILRLGLGLQVVLYCLSFRGDWSQLFAGNVSGLLTREIAEAVVAVESPLIPRISWLVTLGGFLGLREQSVLFLVWICLLSAGVCLLLGIVCQPAAIAAWFLHLCAAKSGQLFAYGMDNFTTIGLFYLMIAPLPDSLSLDRHLWSRKVADKRLLGFHKRVLQVHLCLIYFFGGIAKCAGAGWWNGNSIWRALTRPPFNVIPAETLISWKYFFPVFTVSICLLETGYSLFIWGHKTQRWWLACILGMHIAIGLTMRMYLFALIMIILNVAAFGPDLNFIPRLRNSERNPASQ
jgi:hypothetical protein